MKSLSCPNRLGRGTARQPGHLIIDPNTVARRLMRSRLSALKSGANPLGLGFRLRQWWASGATTTHSLCFERFPPNESQRDSSRRREWIRVLRVNRGPSPWVGVSLWPSSLRTISPTRCGPIAGRSSARSRDFAARSQLYITKIGRAHV